MGLDRLLRLTVTLTLVPGAPRSSLTASLVDMSRVSWPSMRRMTSPGRRPALSAGVPSMGLTTTIQPSFLEISMPTPPNSPDVLSFKSA